MFIDPHVHCRDGRQAYKETIAHALRVAERAGFTAVFDMPNTDPPLTTRKLVEDRLALARRAESPVWYGVYVGLTADADQVKRAVETYHVLKEVVGFKLYAGRSVGGLGVTRLEDQCRVYETLAREKYLGVVAVHCEKELLVSPDWNPKVPVSWALARPWQAEVESVKDQLVLAREAGFRGTVHVAHVSAPDSVYAVRAARGVRATCGVTPHHLMLDCDAMKSPGGLLLKVNPPLRNRGMNKRLLELLREGMIDWVESDHAPHTLEEKVRPPYLSGIANLSKYPKFLRWLLRNGVTRERLREVTFRSVVEVFGLALGQRRCVPEFDLEGEYAFDPYAGLGVV